jgi:hypothetical protein
LLLSANLGYLLAQPLRNRLTSHFELLCLTALQHYLPANGKTILFGKNPLNKDTRYQGKLYKKILNLAEELNELATVQEKDYHPSNTGDDGLDLVGYIPFEDRAEGMLYTFANVLVLTNGLKNNMLLVIKLGLINSIHCISATHDIHSILL